MLVIVGTRTDPHSLRSQVEIGSESGCLLGQLDRILRISDSKAGVKKEKLGGVVGEEDECGDDVVGLLERDRQRLNILSVSLVGFLENVHVRGILGYKLGTRLFNIIQVC